MVDTVKMQRTHYEVLGLEPAATRDEIELAFASSISIFQPHGFGGVAEAAVAFRTLRDPARRRAYDAELGLTPEPPPRPSPMTWRVGAQFLTASGTTVLPPAGLQPRSDAPVQPATAEPEAAPFIAAALRELARPEPLVEAKRPTPVVNTRAQTPETVREEMSQKRDSDDDRRIRLALAEEPGEVQDGTFPWKRAGIAAGAMAAAVALLGAWAGWDGASGAEPAENAARAVLPPPTTFTVSDPAAGTATRVLDVVPPPPPRRTAHAAARVAQPRPTSRLAGLERQLSEPSEPVAAQASPNEQAVDSAPVTPAAASMPLPNRVIARTIERIGYPCGQIASTIQSGAPGVFTVTCTSGHSYQAAPVRGRYHFRRITSG